MSRKGKGKVETRSKWGRGNVKVRSRQYKHNLRSNYNFVVFDIIEINPVVLILRLAMEVGSSSYDQL